MWVGGELAIVFCERARQLVILSAARSQTIANVNFQIVLETESDRSLTNTESDVKVM